MIDRLITKGEVMENLGKKAKDKITSFEGVITGRIDYLYGCHQYGLTSKINKEGKNYLNWYDEGRLEKTGKGIAPKEVKAEKNGADASPSKAEGYM